jgi:hypothetical protein
MRSKNECGDDALGDDVTVGGVRVDLDVVESDYLRNRPVWGRG